MPNFSLYSFTDAIRAELAPRNTVISGTKIIDRHLNGGAFIYESQTIKRVFITLTAILGWLALGLLLYVTFDHSLARGRTIPHILTYYFSLFTVLTNILVALILTASLFVSDSKNFFLRPNVQSAVTVYIVIVGIVDFLFLDGFGRSHGLKLVAECLLHVVVPILYIIFWFAFVPKGTLLWINPFSWLVYPLIYFGYILLRGALTGKYPYRFMNAVKFGYEYVFLNGAEVFLMFIGLGLLLVAIDHGIGTLRSSTAVHKATI
jgi:hypothetical protein